MANSERPFNEANILGLDYKLEANNFARLEYPIIDSHTHINGIEACKIYSDAAKAFGIGLTYSMTQYEQIDSIKKILGNRIRFIAMPKFADEEKNYNNVKLHISYLEKYYDKGARIFKFWSAPRGIDYGENAGLPDLLKLNSPRRIEIMRAIANWGVVFMVHVSDPDTWFSTKYSDSKRYGTKLDQYKALEEILDIFDVPVIAAHMGGWPENLDFLKRLLERHPNLYLDSSATKWMVREMSKYSRDEIISFFNSTRGRILFGSDIVSNDTHVSLPVDDIGLEGVTEESLRVKAFDLYASRYWALRKLFESDYNGKSPIVDPDLAMLHPEKYTQNDSAQLVGHRLPSELLNILYHQAAYDLLESYHE